ncbi:cation:proton antiporter subunit C [Megalodesulfovibrio paquesii]
MLDMLLDILSTKYNYAGFIILMCIGLWAMIGKRNLPKKILGMNIFQTAIMLFYISIAVKAGATLPIIDAHGAHGGELHVNAADYLNPLPHVLMLTAIVVSVATLGVALALVQKIYREHETLEEPEILEQLRK